LTVNPTLRTEIYRKKERVIPGAKKSGRKPDHNLDYSSFGNGTSWGSCRVPNPARETLNLKKTKKGQGSKTSPAGNACRPQLVR